MRPSFRVEVPTRCSLFCVHTEKSVVLSKTDALINGMLRSAFLKYSDVLSNGKYRVCNEL
ncbi:unnamed protein product [Callosobruchus maculatus]|uniref:Uncharacterized protein n=1 Tax=Callosobruchus maculatus TaxID=64391 RepID=A0A653DQI2_CALMS|nr:unnamed protein product [Callosobruchus maculatus]